MSTKWPAEPGSVILIDIRVKAGGKPEDEREGEIQGGFFHVSCWIA